MENEKGITIYFIIFIDIFGIGMAARTLYNVIYTIRRKHKLQRLFQYITKRLEISSPYELSCVLFVGFSFEV